MSVSICLGLGSLRGIVRKKEGNVRGVPYPKLRPPALMILVIPGTIFGVYLADPSKSARENALQPGNKLVAGGYCLYSSSTVSGRLLPRPPRFMPQAYTRVCVLMRFKCEEAR